MGRAPPGLDRWVVNLCATESGRACLVWSKAQPPWWSDCLQDLSISAQKGTGEAFAVKNCVISATFRGREPTDGGTGVSCVR
jgi:hypothetical protein